MSDYTFLPPKAVRHHIGRCPSCGCGLYADLSVVVEVGEPRMGDDGKPAVYCRAFPVGAHIDHTCEKDRDLW